jgi:hypothetical protein
LGRPFELHGQISPILWLGGIYPRWDAWIKNCGNHDLQLLIGLVIYVAASFYLTGEQVQLHSRPEL